MNPNNSTSTITPPTGYTPAALAQANLNTTLAGMPTMPQPQVQQDLGQAAGAQANLQSAYPTWARGTTGNLQQQAGIPQLQSGMSNLSSLFPIYLADQQAQQGQTGQNVGQTGFNQYANPQAFQQFTPSTLQDYQNANPQALINQVLPANTFNSGFQGFNSPGMLTQAGGVVPQSASNLISSLANAIGFENSNLVSPAMATASESYQGQLDMLNNVISNLTGQQQFYEQSELNKQNLLYSANAQKQNAIANASNVAQYTLSGVQTYGNGYLSASDYSKVKQAYEKALTSSGFYTASQADALFDSNYQNLRDPSYINDYNVGTGASTGNLTPNQQIANAAQKTGATTTARLQATNSAPGSNVLSTIGGDVGNFVKSILMMPNGDTEKTIKFPDGSVTTIPASNTAALQAAQAQGGQVQ